MLIFKSYPLYKENNLNNIAIILLKWDLLGKYYLNYFFLGPKHIVNITQLFYQHREILKLSTQLLIIFCIISLIFAYCGTYNIQSLRFLKLCSQVMLVKLLQEWHHWTCQKMLSHQMQNNKKIEKFVWKVGFRLI